jgi:hypothetical protein
MLTSSFTATNKKIALALAALVFAFVTVTIIQDFIRAALKNSAFYFSESFLFSSFWWLFAPCLFAQYVAAKKRQGLKAYTGIIILPILVHLFAFPSLVWVVSKFFYYHTYSYGQTFTYTLSEHVYPLLLIYSIPVFISVYLKKGELQKPALEPQEETTLQEFISTILVADGTKKYKVAVADILYVTANPPYINIYTEGKKYLHKETLKSVCGKLNPDQFVRIHKSAIVNIHMVASYATRLNGDYDVTMKNNVQLRVSRNFATVFKNSFNNTHRFTPK